LSENSRSKSLKNFTYLHAPRHQEYAYFMDNLKTIIHTLGREDLREFRVFINRQKAKRNRKDLELFDILSEEEDYKPDVIIMRLYNKRNKEAYHALRKRLIKHLMDFIVLKRMDDDTTSASSIMAMLSLARYLFDKKATRLAWLYLRKAEETALGSEQYELLNAIYNLMIEESGSEDADPLEEVIAKRNQNKQHADEDEKAILANAVIRQKLQEIRVQGLDIDFDHVIESTYQKYGLNTVVQKRPKLLYSTLSIARSAILAKKDFTSFEPFIIGKYKEVEREKGFSKTTHFYKLSFLYVIAHVLYRNKKFNEALTYTNLLGEELERYNRSHLNLFHPRFTLLLAAIKSFSGKCEESAQLLEDFLSNSKYLGTQESLNAKLNLAVYYFQQEKFRAANQILLSIHHTDRWLEKKMGKEWVFKKGLIEVIVQAEMANDDIALNRIRSLERYFGKQFDRAPYERAKPFMNFLRAYLNDPQRVTDADFIAKAEADLVVRDREEEDIQAMTFYAWLKSKMYRQNYYEVLLKMVSPNS